MPPLQARHPHVKIEPPTGGGHAGEFMDTASWVFIGLAAAGGVGTVVWFWIRRVQMGLDENAKAINGKASQSDFELLKTHISDFEVRNAKEHAETRLRQSQFEAECAKNFVSNPALMQVMSSLDRTIQSLTQAIQHNAQESREGIKAINDRIDNLMHSNANGRGQ